MPHCTTCHKKYTRLTGLQRHRAVCELLSRSSFCKKADLEEQADLPPITELWSIVKTLATQVEKQKKEIQLLKQSEGIHQKKIKVKEWLDLHSKPKLTYHEWIETIEITKQHLQSIFDAGFVKGFINILQSISSLEDEQLILLLPLCAFNHKKNILYHFDGREWSILKIEDFKQFISGLYRKLMVHYKVWFDKNQSKIENINSSPIYLQNHSKMMGGIHGRADGIKRIHIGLYQFLKIAFATMTS